MPSFKFGLPPRKQDDSSQGAILHYKKNASRQTEPLLVPMPPAFSSDSSSLPPWFSWGTSGSKAQFSWLILERSLWSAWPSTARSGHRTPWAMGSIMAVAAALLIHMDRKALMSIKPSSRLGGRRGKRTDSAPQQGTEL